MTRYAFLIGCEEYNNFANIAFCEADVELIQETLLDYCDYEYKNMQRIFQYKGCDDSPNIIYSKLQEMIDNTEKGDSILFYFAGHGAKEDEKGYLLLADSKANDFQKTALDLAKINELLRKSNIDCFMILDACHSGIFTRNAFISSVSDIISDTGCVTLASCSANEESYSYQEMEQGVFTYYLCEEIKKISFGEPIFIENLKMKVCKSVIEWGKKNCKIQTPTLNGQIVGNKAFAYRNYNNYTIESINTNQIKCKLDNINIKKYRECIIAVQSEKDIAKQSEIRSSALSLMHDKTCNIFNRKFSKYKNYEMDFIHEGYFSILYMLQELSPNLKEDEIEQYLDVCINNFMQKYVDKRIEKN